MAELIPSGPRTPLDKLEGLGEKTREKILAHGVSTVEELAGMTPEQLMAIPGIGEKILQRIADAVRLHFEGEAAAEKPAPAGEPAAAEPAAVSEPVAETADADTRQGD